MASGRRGDSAQSNPSGNRSGLQSKREALAELSGPTVAFEMDPAKDIKPQGQAFRATNNDGRKIKGIGADAALTEPPKLHASTAALDALTRLTPRDSPPAWRHRIFQR
jgi:hypothetical protein